MSEVFVKDQLVQLIAKLERLEKEKIDISEDIKNVLAEAKSHGFDVKILKQVLKLRKLDKNKLAEQEAILELYLSALEV